MAQERINLSRGGWIEVRRQNPPKRGWVVWRSDSNGRNAQASQVFLGPKPQVFEVPEEEHCLVFFRRKGTLHYILLGLGSKYAVNLGMRISGSLDLLMIKLFVDPRLDQIFITMITGDDEFCYVVVEDDEDPGETIITKSSGDCLAFSDGQPIRIVSYELPKAQTMLFACQGPVYLALYHGDRPLADKVRRVTELVDTGKVIKITYYLTDENEPQVIEV